MTLIKSILLGSAAGIVAIAGAQAADLPTKKAAPVVQYVKICNVGGITGWTLPGSDTCVRLSGYITAQFVAGNLNTQYNWGNTAEAAALATGLSPGAASALAALSVDARTSQRVLVAASEGQGNSTFYRNAIGWSMSSSFGFDIASNTAYGPLIGHFDFEADLGNGLDPLNGSSSTDSAVFANEAYLTWAGITAGKAASFYSFTGGGDNWANFLSPDQKGFNEPTLLAYTASFGGGFSATISIQSQGTVNNVAGGSGSGTNIGFPNNGAIGGQGGTSVLDDTFGGQKWPDVVGNLHVTQGWGEAGVSGVVHDVNVRASSNLGGNFFNTTDGLGFPYSCGFTGTLACNSQETKTGWGIDAGVKFLLNNWWGGFWGAGDNFLITGAYSQSAVWYGGMGPGEMMWGEGGQVNGNGQPMYLADAYFNPLTNQWSKPDTWSITALLEHHFTPQFYVDLEGSYGELSWSNNGGGCNFAIGLAGCSVAQAVNGSLAQNARTWIIGADLGWNPVTNLNFDLELMYQSTNQDRPSGFLGTVYNAGLVNPNGTSAAFFVPGQWHGTSDGFAGRLRITRYF